MNRARRILARVEAAINSAPVWLVAVMMAATYCAAIWLAFPAVAR